MAKAKKVQLNIAEQFFCIILGLLLVGGIIAFPPILIPFVGLIILYLVRRKKKAHK